MPTDKYLNKIVLNKMTREQFENLTVKNPDEFYAITDKDSELNNPFSLLDYKFSEYALNNISWLRSQGQYNSKAIYPAVYDLLLKIYNGTETKAGVSVKLHTDTSATDYDFRINTAEETFMLPIKVKLASGKAVVGNGMALGLTNGVGFGGVSTSGTNASIGDLRAGSSAYGAELSTTGVSSTLQGVLGVTTDSTKSGIELSDSDLYLYFYVGETVQNANLINAGRIEEKIASLITIVETYQNGTSWYRVWSDGWCEQGGYYVPATTLGTITLLKSYKDTSYSITTGGTRTSNDNMYMPTVGVTKTISNFSIYCGSTVYRIYWQASGYIR